MTTTNEHTERAELIKGLRDLAEIDFDNLFMRAAAMLEAQRPALRPLTDEQIDAVDCVRYDEHDEVDKASIRDFARAIIAEFCRINGITGEAQPAEQAKGREAAALMDECLVAIHAAACTLGNFGSYFFGCSRQVGLRQDQVEQYQEMHRKAEEGVNALMDLHDQLRGLQPDHTTPPAQPAREWVSLTDAERSAIAKRNTVSTPCPEGCEYTCGESVAMDTEAKLREKNAGLPAADDKAGGEPVARVVGGNKPGATPWVRWQCIPYPKDGTLLYTRPKPQAEVRVPDGYVLVPVEPTDDMLNCAQDRVYSLFRVDACIIWDAMLAAAPKPKDDLPTILKKQAS